MSEPRIERLSRVLVDYSTQIGHGDVIYRDGTFLL